jgi:hypothetical protein
MRNTRTFEHSGTAGPMNGGQWLEELANWLEQFPWQWFCTLTFRQGPSPARARWRLLRWADELRNALGTPGFQWVGVPEDGSTGLHFHFHVLIAGLNPGCGAAERLCWMRRWYKLAGDARIEDFEPNCGGVRYVLKHVVPDDMDAIEFHLATPVEMKSGAKQKVTSR